MNKLIARILTVGILSSIPAPLAAVAQADDLPGLAPASASASTPNYCLAIRGNGQLEPAHWGALANVVERLGLPQAQAGGSSASITMLLLDAIATNPLAARDKITAALLLKSLRGFMGELTLTPEWQDFMALYGDVQELKQTQWATALQTTIETAAQEKDLAQAQTELLAHAAELKRTYTTAVKLGLVRPDSYGVFFAALQRLTQPQDVAGFAQDLKVARFYAGEMYKTVSVLGAFDARTDNGLFFRPGVVDFDRLAGQFGRIADFYSARNASPAEHARWADFIKDCAAPALGLTWDQLILKTPACGTGFSALVQTHFRESPATSFAGQAVGTTIVSFPSTAVLTGHAHVEARAAAAEYAARLDPNFGQNFALSNPEEVRFGYWGRTTELARAAGALDSRDEKSRRFLNLGPATWQKALALSPAEPGLSPFKNFDLNGVEVTSAGGWSDLHPVQLLRAAGCATVVYVGRRGGESLFAQGVAKRLLGLDRAWTLLSTSTPADYARSWALNSVGDLADLTSLWSKLYNMGNPASSIHQAYVSADAILCTDWDNDDIKFGVRTMIERAYASPYVVAPFGNLGGAGLAPVVRDCF